MFNLFLMSIFTLVGVTEQESVDKHAAFHLSFVPSLTRLCCIGRLFLFWVKQAPIVSSAI